MMPVREFSNSPNYPLRVGNTYIVNAERKRLFIAPELMVPNTFYYADSSKTVCAIKNDVGALEIFELDANALEKLLKEGDSE